MNSMLGVLLRIPAFKLFRRLGRPRMLPLNLTLSPSPKCNSRCLTCNIWIKRENELTLEEWRKVLASLGRAPYWFTISGGEPLMYPHVVELAQSAYEQCRPGVINIPTNAILPSIPETVERIARSCPQSQVIINLSLDGVGEKHDFIRGVPGNFEKFEHCLEQLRSLRGRQKNLTVGIHSVVSVFNVDHLDEIIAYADRSGADQFITEIAEPRVELDTVGAADHAGRGELRQGRRPTDPLRAEQTLPRRLQNHGSPAGGVLQTGKAYPGRAGPGDRLLRGLGKRPYLRRWDGMAVLCAGR